MDKKQKTKLRGSGTKFPSELRSNTISNDWVIIATGRGKKPATFKKEKRKKIIPPKSNCPFCNIDKIGKTCLIFAKGRKTHGNKIPHNWTTIVIPNKYPALIPSCSLNEKADGFFRTMDGVGYHEVVVFHDHQKSFALFSVKELEEVITAYQDRYLELMKKSFTKYISIFHNHGQDAGASIFHPHSQILAVPVMDPDLNLAISNSKKYFEQNKKCVYCGMNEWEQDKKERIVFENKEFLVLCPFVSKSAFEMIITPKKHMHCFERINGTEKLHLAVALKEALFRLYKALNDPPYNFYIHTSPVNSGNYDFYHWHLTILPKTATWAGFELSTGIEISTIEPEKAAQYLRKQ